MKKNKLQKIAHFFPCRFCASVLFYWEHGWVTATVQLYLGCQGPLIVLHNPVKFALLFLCSLSRNTKTWISPSVG